MKYRCYTFLGFTTTSLDHEWLPSPLPLEKEAWALSFVSSTLAFLPVCNTIGPQNRQSVKAFCLAIYGVRVDTAKVCGKHHYKMNFATLGGNLGRARISNCQLVFAQLPLKGWNFFISSYSCIWASWNMTLRRRPIDSCCFILWRMTLRAFLGTTLPNYKNSVTILSHTDQKKNLWLE